MHRTLSPSRPSPHTHLRDYLQLAKALSRDKSTDPREERPPRRASRSPKEPLERRDSDQYRQLQERYLELEGRYRELLETVRVRGAEHEKLKAEIKTCQKNRERDALEIERLRCIIGLVKKRSVSIQVEEDQLDTSFPRGSRLNKFDQSTDDEIKLKNSAEKIHSRERPCPSGHTRPREEWELPREASQQMLFSRSKLQYNVNQCEKEVVPKYSREMRESISSSKVKLSNSPYSKLRFVPSFK